MMSSSTTQGGHNTTVGNLYLCLSIKMCPFSWEGKPCHGGMQCSIFLCLSQSRINWDGCGRRASGIKMGGWWRWIADWSGWSASYLCWKVTLNFYQPTGWSGAFLDCWCVCLLLSSLVHKVQRKLSSGTSSPGWSQKVSVSQTWHESMMNAPDGTHIILAMWPTYCLEGKRKNYQICSVQQLCTVHCTHIWTDLTGLWIRFCLTGPISLCLDSFLQRAQCSHCKHCISYDNSVCLSVRPSHAGIVSKRRHVARCSLHRWIAKCV